MHSGVAPVSTLTYFLTSCRSVLLYLKLAVWPRPLVFYYGMGLVHGWGQAAPYLLGVAALAAGSMIALICWPAVGFLAAWILVILVPTTSVVPLAGQPTAEHRFYLSLAGVVAFGVLALYRWIGRRALAVMIFVIPLGGMTVVRNKVYGSEIAIWRDTAKKIPDDPEVRREYALVLLDHPGRLSEAIAEFQTVARMRPDVQAFTELGWAQGHTPDGAAEAVTTVRKGLSYAPRDPLALQALGLLYLQEDRPAEAAEQFRATLRSRPHWALAEGHLADADRMLGTELMRDPARAGDAMAVLQEAVRLKPELTTAHTDLGWLVAHTDGGLAAGIAEVRAGLKFHPEDAYAHNTLGLLLMHAGRGAEAIEEFRAAVRAKPEFEEARRNLEHAEAGS
jgi:Flp pilus assembly protein TadD